MQRHRVLRNRYFFIALASLTSLGFAQDFDPAILLFGRLEGVDNVAVGDLDGDGDLDVLTAASGDDSIVWFENLGGAAGLRYGRRIGTSVSGPIGVRAIDVDSDGDADIIASFIGAATIGWMENLDGRGSFGSLRPVTTSARGAIDVVGADVDGDGDLVTAARRDDTIAWYENLDGNGTFGSARDIVPSGPSPSLHFVDLDGDGAADLLGANSVRQEIAWYRNTICQAHTATETVRAGVPPNPIALLPGTIAPRIGTIWDPRVDHSTFAVSAFADALVIDVGPPINVPIASGTLLCSIPPGGQIFIVVAGQAFAVPVPPDCSLVGLSACAQAASLSVGQIELTNGLDIGIGNR